MNEALELACKLDAYARGDEYQRVTEEAAAMLRSQAAEIEGWKKDQKENLRNQCDLHAEIERLTRNAEATDSAVISERESMSELLQMALDERDHYIKERDKLTMVLAERTVERDEYQRAADDMAAAHKVERDGLRKVARMALEWLDWLNAATGPISPPHTAKDVQNALRKELSE